MPPNEQIRFAFNGLSTAEFRRAFPKCRNIAVVLDGFYVKKYYFPDERRTVHYIASRMEIPESFSTQTQAGMIQFVKGFGNNYISQASCSNGQITYIETKPHARPHEFNKFRYCGFASLLAFFCFIDEDHLYQPSGYQIDADNDPGVPGTSQGIPNPWNNGNMPQLKDGITGFNNIVCKIIYVKYHQRAGMTGPTGARESVWFTPRGNKALIYAAYADSYDELVTYTPNPGCRTGGEMGNVFQIPYLLTHINKNNPRNPTEPMLDFIQHFGNDWYFCKRESYLDEPIDLPLINLD